MARSIAPSISLIKPTSGTHYHIDYDWWARSGQDLHLYLRGHLCDEHKSEFANGAISDEIVEWIDLTNGEVLGVDTMTYALMSHCSQQLEYLSDRTSLVDAVFRVFVASGNRPLTPIDLAAKTSRSADTILKTLSGKTIYRGLRPVTDS